MIYCQKGNKLWLLGCFYRSTEQTNRIWILVFMYISLVSTNFCTLALKVLLSVLSELASFENCCIRTSFNTEMAFSFFLFLKQYKFLATDALTPNQKEWGYLPASRRWSSTEPVPFLSRQDVFAYRISNFASDFAQSWRNSRGSAQPRLVSQLVLCCDSRVSLPWFLPRPPAHAATPPFPHNFTVRPRMSSCPPAGGPVVTRVGDKSAVNPRDKLATVGTASLLMRSHLKGDDSSGERAGLDCFSGI